MYLKNKRIFIVEDNISNRAIEQLLLEQQGALTAIDRWGKETVPRLRAFMPVDIILLDLMFPNDVTGYDVFSEIRSHTEFNGIPIVAVSASDPSVAIPKTRAFGFDGFISKPVNYDRFPQEIYAIIGGESIWAKS